MRFAEMTWFLGLLLLPLLVTFFVWSHRRKVRDLARFGNPALLDKLTRSRSLRKRNGKLLLLLLTVFFLVIALARPQWGTRIENVHRRGLDIVIALDTSLSMMTDDIKPSRLVRARAEVASMLDRLQGDRVALVAFAGTAFLHCPLTHDHGAVKMFLDLMDPDIIPVPGTNLSEAIRVSTKAFEDESLKYKVVILITDGEDHEGGVIEAAKEAAKKGIRIYTIGVGSTKGELIRIPDGKGGFFIKRDGKGEPVLSRLDVTTLQRIAAETDGKFKQSTKRQIELDDIFNEIAGLERRELMSRKYTQYEDRYYHFIALALLFLVVEFFLTERRRVKEVWDGRFS